jgi:glycosyltransferase involved in cell wall biosynthesis
VKILQTSGIYPLPPLGGMEQTIFQLGVEFARAGHESVSIAPSPGRVDSTLDGARFLGFPSWRLSSWVKVPTPAGYRQLARWVRWADVVHVHNPPELASYLASRLAWKYRKPVVAAVVSPGTLAGHPRRVGRLLGRLDESMVTKQIRRADMVQVKNTIDRDYVAALTPRFRYLPDGIPAAFLQNVHDDRSYLQSLGAVDRRPIALYLGRIHPLKGPDHLVRATARLIPRFPNLLSIIAGAAEPSEAHRLGELISSLHLERSVRYVGPVDDVTKLKVIDAADVLVVPSLADFAEGFSMVSSEAWARGKPVAAYAVGALRVRVQEGVNGALATPGDVEQLSDAIVRALALGRVSPPSDVRSWTDVAKEFLGWYAELVRGRAAPGRSAGTVAPRERPSTGAR